jgi:long-chain fatty acid transport protein
MNKQKAFDIRVVATSVLMLAATSPAWSGGLYISEFGDPSQGASGAGAGVLAQDASTAAHNPAGIMLLEPGKNHWMITGMYIDPSATFAKEAGTTVQPNGSLPGGNGGDAGVSTAGAAFFWARPINEKVGFGFALNSVAAAALDYKSDNTNSSANNFVGRYWATEVDLLTVNLTPSVAWRINEQWSLGFSIPVQVGKLDLNAAIPIPPGTLPAGDGNATISNGNDVSATLGASFLWEASDRVRIGAAYQGENKLDFGSDLAASGPLGGALPVPPRVDVSIPFVQTARLWGSTEVSDQVTLLATLAWENWGAFDNLLVQAGGATAASPRNWKDTWKIALGLRWHPAGAWTHYAGIAYDTSPVDENDRTTDMPMDEQLRLSLGTNYLLSNGVSVGGVLTYADYGDARINNTASWGTVAGSYTTNRILFVGLNVGW